ncbi:MAG: hypothetical protein D6705_09285 [Deltaproteobacteria bacterium]|nr:MAG: hypothetical protein D6705_09285 [Deltaproteobacteria bacterium]
MPAPDPRILAQSLPRTVVGIDEAEVRAFADELDDLARELVALSRRGGSLAQAAVDDATYPTVATMHTALRDAMLLEVPSDLLPLVSGASTAGTGPAVDAMARSLATSDSPHAPPRLLARFFVYEAIRLRLLVAAWAAPAFDMVGGTEADIDAMAERALELLEGEAALGADDVRPLLLFHAAAAMLFARYMSDRAEALRHVGEDLREELRMQARLKTALRSLRLPESVLLENALADLLGQTRRDLSTLKRRHALALSDLSRQAMDQRVSRSRRALRADPARWPTRRSPALFDILRRTLAGPPEPVADVAG